MASLNERVCSLWLDDFLRIASTFTFALRTVEKKTKFNWTANTGAKGPRLKRVERTYIFYGDLNITPHILLTYIDYVDDDDDNDNDIVIMEMVICSTL